MKKLLGKLFVFVIVFAMILGQFPQGALTALAASDNTTESTDAPTSSPEPTATATPDDTSKPEPTPSVSMEPAPTDALGDLSIIDLSDGTTVNAQGLVLPACIPLDDEKRDLHVKELKQNESAYSVTYQNSDGTNSFYMYDIPVKYKDQNGKYQFIDNSLVSVKDAKMAAKGFKYQNKSNDLGIYFPEDLVSDKYVRMEKDGFYFEMKPDFDIRSDKEVLSGKSFVSDVQFQGKPSADKLNSKYVNTVNYGKSMGNDVDLEYSTTWSGVKENIILNKYTGQNTFDFIIRTNGKPEMQEDYAIFVNDKKTGDMLAFVNNYNAKDSYSGDRIEGDGHDTLDITAKLLPVEGQEDTYRLSITIDKGFLENPNTVYPVIIDPSFTMQDANNSEDCYEDTKISDRYDQNYGAYQDLNFGYWGSLHVARMFTQFSLTRFKRDNHPFAITDAYYRGYCPDPYNSNAVAQVYRVGDDDPNTNDNWTTTGTNYLRWANKPNISNLISYKAITGTNDPRYINLDITQLVQNWISNTWANHGFCIKMQDETASSNYTREFYSAEMSTYPPSIVITYSNVDTYPPDNVTSLNMTATAGSINSGTATLNLSWSHGADKPTWNPHLAGYYIYLTTTPNVFSATPTLQITNPDQTTATISNNIFGSTTYQAAIVAYDSTNLKSPSLTKSSVLTTPDTTAPQISSFTINSGNWTRESDPQITWVASDNSGVLRNQDAVQLVTQQDTITLGSTPSGNINIVHDAPENKKITGLQDGQNTVYLRVYDQSNNYCQSPATLYKLDTTNPSLSITSPSSNATVSGTVPIVATILDNGSGIGHWRLEYAEGKNAESGFQTLASSDPPYNNSLQNNTLSYDWVTDSLLTNQYYTLRLYAIDNTTSRDAGKNETYLSRNVFISANTTDIEKTIIITSPDTTLPITTSSMDVGYEPSTGLTDVNLLIDGVVVDSDSSNGLRADLLQYTEGSTHKLVIRAKNSGQYVYSDQAKSTAFIDNFEDGTQIGTQSTAQRQNGNILLPMNGSTYAPSAVLYSAFSNNTLDYIGDIKISVGEDLPSGTYIHYFVNTGTSVAPSWQQVTPGDPLPINSRLSIVELKAELHTQNSAITPKLLWWRADAVSLENAQEFTVQMVEIPKNLASRGNVNYTNLSTWDRVGSENAGITYNIYRGDNANFEPSAENKINTDSIKQPFFYDGRILYNTTVFYKVTAVKIVGTDQNDKPIYRESKPSPQGQSATFVSQGELDKRIGLEDYWRYSGFSAGAGNGYVNVSTGALTFQSTDFIYPSPFLALAMTRTYNSNASSTSAMGTGWDFSYNTLLMYETNNVDGNVILKDGDGSIHRFTPIFENGANTGRYNAPTGVFMALTHNIEDGTWTIKRNDNITYLFGSDMLISRFTDANGNYIEVKYTDFGYIDTVTCHIKGQVNDSQYYLHFYYFSEQQLPNPNDPSYQEIETWNNNHRPYYGMLQSVVDSANRIFSYEYDTYSGYKKLSYRTTSTGSDAYKESFAYDTGNLYITNGENKTTEVFLSSEGKVNEIHFPIDTERLSFLYPPGSGYPEGQTVVTDQNNHTFKFDFDINGLVTTVTDQLNHATSYTYDDSNWLVATESTEKDDAYSEQPETVTWQYTYNKTPTGSPDRNDYLASANLTSIKDPYNNYTFYREYNEFNEPKYIDVPVRTGVTATTQYEYYPNSSNLMRTTDPKGRISSNTYFENGALETSTDVYGKTTTYEYFGEGDSNGKYGWLKKTILPLGSTTEILEYDHQGNPLLVKDAVGVVTKSVYDLLGRLVRSYEPRNEELINNQWPSSMENDDWESNHSYTGNIYNLDNTVEYSFDANVGEAVEYTRFTYDDMGRLILTEQIDPDPDPDPDPDSDPLDPEYNPTILRHSTTEYGYDGQGNRTITKTDPSGVHSYEFYDAAGRLVKTRGDLISGTTYWKQATCEYDTVGNVVKTIDADGNWVRTVYDKLNRKIQTITEKVNDTGTNVVTSCTYDFQGNVLSSTDGDSHTTDYEYDLLNRLKKVTQHATAYNVKTEAGTQQTLVTSYDYDDPATITVDNASVDCIVNTVTDAALGVKKTYLDAQGRVVREENKGTDTSNTTNMVVDTVYNARGEAIKTINNDNTFVSYVYNCRSQLQKQYYHKDLLDPENEYNSNIYLYLESGKLDTAVSSRHIVYDTSANSYSRQTTAYSYDKYDRIFQARQRSQMSATQTFTDSTTNNAEYDYDPADKVLSVKYTLPILNATAEDLEIYHAAILYDYDSFGRLAGTYFDDNNAEDNADKKKVQEYIYRPDGSADYVLTYRNFANSDATNYIKKDFDYYSNDALKSIKYYDNTTLREQYAYEYNKRGMILHETQSVIYPGTGINRANNSADITNSYDEIGRLWKNVNNYTDELDSTKSKNTTTRYQYDNVGNRAYSFADNTGTANDIYLQYTYNEFNMLKAVDIYDNGDEAFRPSATYEYDNGNENMGRQTKETSWRKNGSQYQIDNYAKQAYFLSGEQFYNAKYGNDNVMDGRDLYYYNIDGKRVRKGNDIAGTNYFYSGGAVLYTTRNDIGTLLTENIVTPGGNIVCSKRFEPVEFADKWYTYNYDNRGSVSAILSPEGTLTKEYIYDSFGNATSGGSDTFSNEFQFTGAVADGDGVYYMNSRYYNANTGRFLTQDTYKGNAYEPWTQHLYTYCGNNPVNMVDPTGHRFYYNLGGDEDPTTVTPEPNAPPNPDATPGPNQDPKSPIKAILGCSWDDFELCEYTFFHAAVQWNMAYSYAQRGLGILTTEHVIPNAGANGGFGKADAVDLMTHEVWEVKPVTYSGLEDFRGQDQLQRYADNLPGTPGLPVFDGKINVTLPNGSTYGIRYWSSEKLFQQGMVYYALNGKEGVPYPEGEAVEYPAIKYEINRIEAYQSAAIMTAFAAISVVAAAGVAAPEAAGALAPIFAR